MSVRKGGIFFLDHYAAISGFLRTVRERNIDFPRAQCMVRGERAPTLAGVWALALHLTGCM